MGQKEIIHAMFFTPTPRGWGLVPMLEGPPGRAKSRILEAFAHRCSWPCMVLGASKGEGAYGVTPVPAQRPDGSWRMEYPPSAWVDRFHDAGLVFCDEITSNPQLIQAMQLELLLDKQLGSHSFGPRVRVAGACNPVDYAANGTETSAALANRVGWFVWRAPSEEEHEEYMLSRGAFSRFKEGEEPIDALAEEARVLAVWGDCYAKAAALETTFLKNVTDDKGKKWKNREPKANDPNAARAYPTDRSWEHATLALASSIAHDLDATDTEEFVAAFIGTEAKTAWFTWMEQNNMPNMADLLDGKIVWKPDHRIDMTTIVLATGCKILCDDKCPNREARAIAFSKLLTSVGGATQDVVVPVVKRLMKAQVNTLTPAVVNAYMPIQARVQSSIKAGRDAVMASNGRSVKELDL